MNEKNLIKSRQICFLYLALTPVTKLSLYPSVLAGYAGEALWLSALCGFALELTVIAAALLFIKKHPDKTLYSVIEESTNAAAAKCVFFLYSVFFFLKATLPLIEQKTYIENTLYEIMPSSFVFFPFFVVSLFACLKGMKVFGRIADIAVFVTGAGIITAILLTAPVADYSNLLPLFKKPAYNVINGTFRSIVWHSDGVYMLMFAGHFKWEKGSGKRIILSYAGASLAALVFVATFYSIYGAIAKSQTFALPAATVFSISAANVGRFDFLSIFLLLFSQIFAVVFPLFAAVKCLERVFGLKTAAAPAVVVNALMVVYAIVFGKKLFLVLNLNANVLSFLFLAVTIVPTAILLLLPRRKNESV